MTQTFEVLVKVMGQEMSEKSHEVLGGKHFGSATQC
jgi:hypothetical protein